MRGVEVGKWKERYPEQGLSECNVSYRRHLAKH